MAVPRVLVPLADGFEEIETATIIDVLRRGGANVTVAGLNASGHKGSRRIRMVPDALLSDVENDPFDMIVLPGGKVGVDNLIENGIVLGILQKMKKEDKYIAAICAAPLALKEAGVIENSRLTSYPGLEENLQPVQYEEDRVVVDHKLITSRSPGTAMEFALKIVEILTGREKAENIARLMLVE